ncbi:MAG: creatininase family protein [Myxococcota bacterium]|nr:creatininase family protein [Myxococcota bacterium]
MIFLHEIPHHDARALLESGAPVYLGFNPIEYHGPHLPLACDRLIGDGILRLFTERMAARFPEWPVLVARSIDVGVEPTSGFGSAKPGYRDVRRVVRESCRALMELGAKRIVLHTFHGSGLHNLALESGVRLVREEGGQALAPFHAVLNEMMDLDAERYAPAFAHIEDPDERAAMIAGLHMDFHAGFFETSLAMRFAADAVHARHVELAPCPRFERDGALAFLSSLTDALGHRKAAAEMSFAADARGWYALRPFPGYTGRPHHARAESGAFFAEKIVERYEEAAALVFERDQDPPPAVMQWLAPMTGWGSLEATRVDVRHITHDFG